MPVPSTEVTDNRIHTSVSGVSFLGANTPEALKVFLRLAKAGSVGTVGNLVNARERGPDVAQSDLVYGGAGAREAARDKLTALRDFAIWARRSSWTVNTGGADGCDAAFLGGAGHEATNLFLPWIGYNDHEDGLLPLKDAFRIAEQYHPAWDRLTPVVRKFMARNVHIVLGDDLHSPVRFLLCCTVDGKDSGGTGHTIRVSRAYNIPVLNIGEPEVTIADAYNYAGQLVQA